MSDPASVNVSVQFGGLSLKEATCALDNCAPGASFVADVRQPVLGPKRYQIGVGGLSVQGARDLTAAMLAFFEQMAEWTDHSKPLHEEEKR